MFGGQIIKMKKYRFYTVSKGNKRLGEYGIPTAENSFSVTLLFADGVSIDFPKRFVQIDRISEDIFPIPEIYYSNLIENINSKITWISYCICKAEKEPAYVAAIAMNRDTTQQDLEIYKKHEEIQRLQKLRAYSEIELKEAISLNKLKKIYEEVIPLKRIDHLNQEFYSQKPAAGSQLNLL